MAISLSKNGDVKIGTDAIAEMASWTLTINDEILEADVFGMDWKKVAGIGKLSWTASFNGFLDLTDTEQVSLESRVLSGGDFNDIRFYLDETNYYAPDTGTDANATAYITDFSITVDQSGVNTVSASVQGSGPVYRTA